MSGTRVQNLNTVTGKKKRNIAIIIAICAFVLAGVMLGAVVTYKYRPPALAANAVYGVPEPDESYLYQAVDSPYGYCFGMAVNLYQQEDGSLNVYFTNPEINQVNMKCVIKTADGGTVLYESDVIAPGTYIENLKPKSKFDNVMMEVTVDIMAFEQDSWYSAGTTNVNLLLQPW